MRSITTLLKFVWQWVGLVEMIFVHKCSFHNVTFVFNHTFHTALPYSPSRLRKEPRGKGKDTQTGCWGRSIQGLQMSAGWQKCQGKPLCKNIHYRQMHVQSNKVTIIIINTQKAYYSFCWLKKIYSIQKGWKQYFSEWFNTSPASLSLLSVLTDWSTDLWSGIWEA